MSSTSIPRSGCFETTIAGPEDDNPCSIATCFPEYGWLQVLAEDGVTCDDESACTTADVCVSGICTEAPTSCVDNDPCTADRCDPLVGCVATLRACPDDDNECTRAACLPESGCTQVPALAPTLCNDHNACTEEDKCSGAVCKGSALDCSDDSVCTTDVCDPGLDCVYARVQCPTSPHLCEVAVCDAEDGCGFAEADNFTPCAELNCTDVKACLLGECLSFGQIDGIPCDDGNACTRLDSCQDGVCEGLGGGSEPLRLQSIVHSPTWYPINYDVPSTALHVTGHRLLTVAYKNTTAHSYNPYIAMWNIEDPTSPQFVGEKPFPRAPRYHGLSFRALYGDSIRLGPLLVEHVADGTYVRKELVMAADRPLVMGGPLAIDAARRRLLIAPMWPGQYATSLDITDLAHPVLAWSMAEAKFDPLYPYRCADGSEVTDLSSPACLADYLEEISYFSYYIPRFNWGGQRVVAGARYSYWASGREVFVLEEANDTVQPIKAVYLGSNTWRDMALQSDADGPYMISVDYSAGWNKPERVTVDRADGLDVVPVHPSTTVTETALRGFDYGEATGLFGWRCGGEQPVLATFDVDGFHPVSSYTPADYYECFARQANGKVYFGQVVGTGNSATAYTLLDTYEALAEGWELLSSQTLEARYFNILVEDSFLFALAWGGLGIVVDVYELTTPGTLHYVQRVSLEVPSHETAFYDLAGDILAIGNWERTHLLQICSDAQ